MAQSGLELVNVAHGCVAIGLGGGEGILRILPFFIVEVTTLPLSNLFPPPGVYSPGRSATS